MKKVLFLDFLLISLAVIFLGGICYSSFHILTWMKDNKETTKQIHEVQSLVVIEEQPPEVAADVVVEDAIHTDEKLMGVDFGPLLEKNPEVVGWVQVKGTNINYPFVQHTDNKYYLKKSLDRTYNSAGWVFLDYRNSTTDLDKNTIIYAHGRVDGTMFGTLKNTLNREWFDNSENHILKISTPFYNYVFEVFSIYHIKTTDDYLYTNFISDEQYMNFIDLITSRSVYKFPTVVGPTDKILTLSTCYNSAEKMVLHAKLTMYEKRS